MTASLFPPKLAEGLGLVYTCEVSAVCASEAVVCLQWNENICVLAIESVGIIVYSRTTESLLCSVYCRALLGGDSE